MTEITIAGRKVGTDYPPLIIAEAGINHDGDVQRAIEMVRVAKDAGADVVKFQTFKSEEFVGDANLMFSYRSQGKEVTESMLEMFRRHELNREEWFAVRRECDRIGIIFLSTPQNRSDLDLLLELGIPAVKIGSDDFTNLPLLKSYAETGLPLILSCGMADLGEVYRSLNVVGALDGYPTVLLLCTSQYPTPPEDVNLRKLLTLRAAFPSLVLGFSDHTQGSQASSLAAALEACVFEKHFTLDHDLPGPDHWFSEMPNALREWAAAIRTAKIMLGSSVIRPTRAELEMRTIARRSIVASKDIKKGDVCSMANINLRRPGTGLAPDLLHYFLDGKATRNIRAGECLNFGDVIK